MAMDLRKPLFIARIDDAPLPLHLINRQYTDFRAPTEAALQEADRRAQESAARPSRCPNPSRANSRRTRPQPNRLNFFKYVEQLPDGAENARIARALFEWAKANSDSITFSGRTEPAFGANLWVGPGGVTVFSVRAYAKQPAVEVSLQYPDELSAL